MSGSSLDGLDLVHCAFELTEPPVDVAEWRIIQGATIPFSPELEQRLREATELSGIEAFRLDADFGRFVGESIRDFAKKEDRKASLIGSHGHTVYHFPADGFTTQIGDGATIARITGLPTVTQLRGADVAAGGQGAPLAPFGDRYLFNQYGGCLNLGGIANFSCRTAEGKLVAGDITGAGQILDRLALQAGKKYDESGNLARHGRLHKSLPLRLAQWPYHRLPYPKSLDNTEVQQELYPIINDTNLPVADRLHTFVHFLARTTVDDMAPFVPDGTRVLVTGGGAYNDFLLEKLNEFSGQRFQFVKPDAKTVEFKEAAFIALAALFRTLGIPNSLAAATGAKKDTVNGALYHP